MLTIFCFLLIIRQGLPFPESALFLHLASKQSIAETGWVRLQPWTKSQVPGSFISGIKMSTDYSTILIPKTGLYIVSVHLELIGASRGIYSLALKNLGSEDPLLTSIQHTNDVIGSIAVVGIPRLFIGQELAVYASSSRDLSWQVKQQSSISLRYIGDYFTVPSFLAFVEEGQYVRRDGANSVIRWLPEYNSDVGFSKSTGTFWIPLSGRYFISVNLVLKNLIGKTDVAIKLDGRDILTTSETSATLTLYHSHSLSTVIEAAKKSKITLSLYSTNELVTLTTQTAFSIIRLGNNYPQNSSDRISMTIGSPLLLSYEKEGWKQLTMWHIPSMGDSTWRYHFTDGILILRESGRFLFSCNLNITTTKMTSVTLSMVIDGAANTMLTNPGISKSILLGAGSYVTLSITGIFDGSKGNFVALFLRSQTPTTISIRPKSFFSIDKLRYLYPYVSYPVMDSNATGIYQNWKTATILHSLHPYWQSQTSSVTFKENQYKIERDGIYHISVNLFFKNVNAENIEVCLRIRHVSEIRDFLLHSTGYTADLNSVNFALPLLLQSSDVVQAIYRCSGKNTCTLARPSSISVVLLQNHYLTLGFISTFERDQTLDNSRRMDLKGWTTNKSPAFFNNGKGFDHRAGSYKVPHDGIYLVTCRILLGNIGEIKVGHFLQISIKSQDGKDNQVKDSKSQLNFHSKSLTLGFSVPLRLEEGTVVSLELRAAEIFGFTIKQGSIFSVISLNTPPDNKVMPQGFTVSKRSNDIVSLNERWMPLKDWTEGTVYGGFISSSANLFEFNRMIGQFVTSKASLVLVNVAVSIMKTIVQPVSVSLTLNGNSINDIILISDGNLEVLTTIYWFSVVMYLEPKDSLSVVVDSGNIGNKYFVNYESTFSVLMLMEVQDKPSMELDIRKQMRVQSNAAIINGQWFLPHCEFCYRRSILFEERSGRFKFSFKGVFMISFLLQLIGSASDTVTCNIVLLSPQTGIKTSAAQAKLVHADYYTGMLRYFNILEVQDSSSLTISCKTDNPSGQTYTDSGFVNIAHLPDARNMVVLPGIVASASHLIEKTGMYLVHIGANLVGNRTSILLESSNQLRLNATEEDFVNGYHLDIVLLAKEKKGNQLTIHVQGHNFRLMRNNAEMSLYFLGPNLKSGTLVIKGRGYNVCQNGKGWSRLHSWTVSTIDPLVVNKALIDKLKEGYMIAEQTGQYLLSLALVLSDCKQTRRKVMVVLDGRVNSESNKQFFKSRRPEATVTLSITVAIRIRRWQTVSLYVECAENDTMSIEPGSSWSFVILEATSVPYETKAPVLLSNPQPAYINESYMFNWTCDAVGLDLKPQYWEWINLYTGEKRRANSGKQISLQGRPEESGFYYCVVESGGIVRHSDFGILDVSDVDECNKTSSNWTSPCHAQANCINTIGSYICSCKEGFTGDGKYCEDCEECLTGLHQCDPNAACNNTYGSYACTCNSGYSGNGYVCDDINECTNLTMTRCHLHSVCLNLNGSYDCQCLPGFSGDGSMCNDIDECDLDQYPCDDHASCSNSLGSYSCKCDQGWTGNGTVCEDVDECQTFECAGNATCNNYIGSFRCICDRGYKGDGYQVCEPLGCMPPKYCSGQFKASWWARTPYLTNTSEGTPIGLFKDILQQVMVYCCRNCSQVEFLPPLNGSAELESMIEKNQTDFGCPVYGIKDQSIFRGFPFMPVVESPGVAFFVREDQTSSNPIFASLTGSWPILVITFLLACLSGVVIWFLDTVRNPGEFPNSFVEGSWEGFWWAFITMTTVGYGDKAPRSFGARLFGIIWILIGLVIISTFTATITTMLTASSLSDDIKLYGTKVGALDNSEEYRLGVKRNAEVFSYSGVPKILQSLNERKIQGALVDAYVAGDFQEEFSNYRLHQILEHIFSYGVVLARDGLALKTCFKLFLETKQSEIYGTISKIVRPLKSGRQESSAVEKSTSLFDVQSPFFRYAVYVGVGILAFLFVLGFCWEFFYWRPKIQKAALNCRQVNGEYEWQNGDVMQYQKNIFTHELNDLRNQIRKFADNWISKLDDMERRHKDEVSKVQKWISKRGFVRTLGNISGFGKEENRNGTKRSSLVKLSTFDASEHV